MSKTSTRVSGFRIAICSMLIAAGLRSAVADDDIHTLSLVPGAPPATMSRLWTPVIERLAKESGIRLRLKLFDRMADFERDIWNGTPDFIYSSPIQVVVAHQSSGYIPLVRDSRLVDIGLYVRHDSSIRSIDDLVGKKLAFVGHKNVCSVYMQHQLTSYGTKLSFDREYAGSTRNVIINVLLGKADAGSVFTSEIDREPAETREQLRQVVATPKFAPHPLSAHPRVPSQVREAVKKAMLTIAASADGAAILKPLQLDQLVVADYDKDYRALEAIDIKGMTDWGR